LGDWALNRKETAGEMLDDSTRSLSVSKFYNLSLLNNPNLRNPVFYLSEGYMYNR
jgi:hypothetical protein